MGKDFKNEEILNFLCLMKEKEWGRKQKSAEMWMISALPYEFFVSEHLIIRLQLKKKKM